jgi:hypothetical protein
MKKMLPFATLLLATVLTGCAAGGGYAVMRYGPPPAPRYGIVGVAPGPGYAWADGYWDQRGGRWFWVNGVWRRPPHARAVWVPGSWREEHGRYRFHRGYWR